MLNSSIVIGSEIALALYPILIKTVPTDLPTQLVSRLLTFSVLGYFLGSTADVQRSWGSLSVLPSSLFLGLVTLFHVGTSYYAFQQLDTGVAMSLFYTYPFLNLIVGRLFFGDTMTLAQLVLMIVAFVGVILVAPEVREGFADQTTSEQKRLNLKGVAAGLLAALSETIMYFAVKNIDFPNPYVSMLKLYPGGLVLLLGYLLAKKQSIDLRASVWIPMLLFNALIGFVGYAMRFYAIPKVSTIVFSLLSFIGVVASFLWGFTFVQEVPSLKAILGAGLITGAVGLAGIPS